MDQTTRDVRGMSCEGCEETVRTALEAIDGVVSATADHEDGEVRVSHEAVGTEMIDRTIADAGYEVEG
ncbi:MULTISPECIES: heavy-metal-associated domain-containing protein [Saliphagus]|uniref:Heavy-metal-associated domain-containing protein n=1 Tax=Saliphagus infecundisoli TaxID=1849069 RepID=A0ABD5QEH7_9EURY|nr:MULTISPECIES: heavy metal-associated domain-containing protein [Saliphagus]